MRSSNEGHIGLHDSGVLPILFHSRVSRAECTKFDFIFSRTNCTFAHRNVRGYVVLCLSNQSLINTILMSLHEYDCMDWANAMLTHANKLAETSAHKNTIVQSGRIAITQFKHN